MWQRCGKRAIFLVATLMLIAGCAAPVTATDSTPPPTSAELSRLVLTSTTLPAQFTLLNLGPADQPAQSTPSLSASSCSDLIGGRVFLESATQPYGQSNASVVANIGTAGPWLGDEMLASYPVNGAASELSALRSLVARCPTWNDADDSSSLLASPAPGMSGAVVYHLALTAGPKLGDESVRLQIRTSQNLAGGAEAASDAIFIRVGGVLIVVGEQATVITKTETANPLDVLAAAAYQAYVSRH
jgi:hypothetical protein